MFDCGFSATYKMNRAGVAATDIDRVFFTHHHSDHVADYPALLLSRFDMSIDVQPLRVHGPAGTQQLTDRLIGPDQGAFWPDIVARTSHPLSLGAYERRGGKLPRRPPVTDVGELAPGDELSGDGWTVRTAEVEHVQPYLDSLAYRVETPSGVIVLAGDTRPCRALTELADGADVLIMDCVRRSEDMRADPAYAKYISGSLEAGRTAAEAGVGHLVLVHQHPAMNDAEARDGALEDVASVFGGEVTWGEESLTLEW